VKPALGYGFSQNPGEPGFGVGVICPSLTINEVGEAQTAARYRFDLEQAAQASALLSNLDRAAIGDALDFRVVVVEFDISANLHFERVAILVAIPHPHAATLRYPVAALLRSDASQVGCGPPNRRPRRRPGKKQNQHESDQHNSLLED